jgi:hypothetical protein
VPSLAEVATELFGVRGAQAQTPNTNTPLASEPYTIPPPYSTNGTTITVNVPVGFQAGPMAYGTACRLLNPSYINHLDLFERIPGTSWKGCVEARPAGLDVKEDPPTYGNSRFVPYFWPDEPGGRNDNTWSNSYLDDPAALPGFGGQDWLSILRYNRNAPTAPRIVENQPTTYGPNSACPDEVLPLSSSQGQVVSRINTLQHYFGGGTISSEGVMWAWRTLSPNKPFSDGKPYGASRKFIVLMSDGENMLGGNNNDNPWGISDYTAYGYLWQNRLGTTNYDQAALTLDSKMSAACSGAKARGITIITILFRATSQRAIDNVRNCASRPDLFYKASDQAALDVAFQNVAGQISNLRISH